ncbi:MAG: glycoside hydrolase family 15 protein [Deltaproteobacteria bacterium]|nr:glycoside hydrolase family 15 protein [Deltaproteobacteria bacterium]
MSLQYGIIGNCKTAALVHESGSIDWCCLPNFDSPSAFASLLDPQGGYFKVASAGTARHSQRYIPKTNILETEFDDGENSFMVVDFMPRYRDGNGYKRPVEICRLLRPLKGRPAVRVSFNPRLNYARGETVISEKPDVIMAVNDVEDLYLYSNLPLSDILRDHPIPLTQDAFLLLTYHEKVDPPSLAGAYESFERTKNYWETWSSHCRLPEIEPEAVLRSALTLKLMTYEDTGAIIAAPTTSLPEILHKGRNWDYRYCWLRDASLMLDALKSIGHFEEASAFIHFVLRICESKQTKVQIVYGIDARTDLEEKTLPHFLGYQNSGPVRIGNQAARTKQNDIFGEVLNMIYLYFFHYGFEPMNEEVWSLVKFLVNTSIREWKTQDAGIWEFRHSKAHFTFSKVLSWVAVDRGMKIAQKLGKTETAAKWASLVLEIRADILEKGWSDDMGSFTQAYGSPNYDASLLQLQRYGFLAADDPRWVSTVLRCEEALIRKGFGFRYTSADDFGKPESSFILATLWIAKALWSIGRKERGVELFEKTLAHANHLGLLSEDIDIHTGELLGNFPQAYSHMAVINTANLLGGK